MPLRSLQSGAKPDGATCHACGSGNSSETGAADTGAEREARTGGAPDMVGAGPGRAPGPTRGEPRHAARPRFNAADAADGCTRADGSGFRADGYGSALRSDA